MLIANDVTELVGNTPLVRIRRLTEGAKADGWRQTGAQLPILLLPPQLEPAQIDFVLSALP